MASNLARAQPAVDRLTVVDALRGLALFGILLANVLYWSGWGLMTDAQRVALAGAHAAEWQWRFHHLLVDGKFYTLFSLLFGAGFALQLERLTRRGHDGLRIYRRRVLVLLGFGLVHCYLVWDGDILLLYALLGLVLPLFHRWRDRSLLLAAFVLIFVVPFAGIALFRALGWPPDAGLYALSFAIGNRFGIDQSPDYVLQWLQRDDLRAWLAWIASGPWCSWGLRIETWRIPKVLGIMLLGLWVGRRLAAGTLLDDRRLQWRVLLAGAAIGLPANAIYAWTPGLGQASWPSLVGTVPLGLAYAAAFALAWPHAKRWLGVFAAPGRMALTNYLTHSILGVVLFYGIGFGLTGRVSFAATYAYAACLFAAQVAFSRWWLAHHAQGPMEALWRRLTYGTSAAAGSR
ncbi:MAG: DUF418 domain-containing protein [Luteimonas sp.]